MTQRERQILKWIEANPMITQEQLAQMAGITRSSIGVHIYNLTKKGYIAGRGYVLRSGTYAAVVGGVNMDIGGSSFAPLISGDSNPGKVSVNLGGVGRNIAHNMSLLGIDVRFLTALGTDLYAQSISASCSELGIDITRALIVPDLPTSTYLFINDSDGDMSLALNDMEICDRISPQYIQTNLPILNSAQVVVVDTNLPAATLAFICEHCTAPIFADPVSTVKGEKLRPLLGKLHTLKPNLMEAEMLSGVKITDKESLCRAASVLLDSGLHRVFISLGSHGVLAADQGHMCLIPACKATMRNATGAGDSYMAALASAYLEGMDLESTAIYAACTAALAVEAVETINSDLSVSAVYERMEGYDKTMIKEI